jgi:outer membrane murein-binding lipoprotein Lpp
MMENHINQLSTKYTNHLGDYVEKVASMVYNHHNMMFNKIGAIADDISGVLDQAEGISEEVFEPASLTPTQPPVTLTATRKAKTEVPDNASAETPSTVQDVKLNQWKLPPTLDVHWPKGHSSLWELISNEVGDYVEEVGISVLTALGADVVVSRRLAGTSERHFELDVTWPNGGNHILDEVKNHVRQVEDKVSGKVIRVEDKVDQVVEKVHQMEAKMTDKVDQVVEKINQHSEKVDQMEAKMTKIENMMEQLLEKMG